MMEAARLLHIMLHTLPAARSRVAGFFVAVVWARGTLGEGLAASSDLCQLSDAHAVAIVFKTLQIELVTTRNMEHDTPSCVWDRLFAVV